MVSDPIFFECTQCGDCCRGYGGTYLSEADMEAIADHIGISKAELIERYCTLSGNRYVLTQRDDGFCVFWDRLCTIHAVKPKMCRQWPFIPSLLKDVGNWRIMASVCPGIHADADEEHLRAYVLKKLG